MHTRTAERMQVNLVQTSGGAEVKVPGAEPITQERPVNHCFSVLHVTTRL